MEEQGPGSGQSAGAASVPPGSPRAGLADTDVGLRRAGGPHVRRVCAEVEGAEVEGAKVEGAEVEGVGAGDRSCLLRSSSCPQRPPLFHLAPVRSGPRRALLGLPNRAQMGCLKRFRWSAGLVPAANQSLNSGE